MLKNRWPKHGSCLRSALPKMFMVVMLFLALAISASAYTLVFRTGQRLEIPSEFELTRTTLTYEISPGFNKTILLNLIDVAATERVNHEAPGAFFTHKAEAEPANPEPRPRAVRTVTNSDLAAVRQRRVASEQAYEARRQELSLPTIAETRRRQAEDEASVREQIRETKLNNAREESYWRGRARALRAEIATVDAQIGYVRGRLNEVKEDSLNNLVLTDVYPIQPNQPWGLPYPNYPNSNFPNSNYPYPGYPYPNYPYPNYPYPNYPYPNSPYGFPRARPIPGMGYPYPYPTVPNYNDASARQEGDLTNRLDDLITRRAGLAAQWHTLEDEARDARVPQIWLEP